MAEIKNGTQAIVAFLWGLLSTIILWQILPFFIELLNVQVNKAIFYIGMIILGFLLVAVIPASIALSGKKEETE